MNTPRFISLKPFYGKTFLKNKIFEINNGHNIFYRFKERVDQKGINVDTFDISPSSNTEKYIYLDMPYPWEIGLWFKILSNLRKNVLFCFESPLVNPFSQMKLLHAFFTRVYAWDDNSKKNAKYKKFFIPQLNSGIYTKEVSFKTKNFLVLINAAKSAIEIFKVLSPYKDDLYKKRKEAANFFEKEIPGEFSIFGPGWNLEKHPSYKGIIDKTEKLKTLAKYKFCICFENASAPGYITEKIFDCFKAKCVPVYLGAPNIEKYVPEKSFIDYRKFKNYEDLLLFLNSISEKDYRTYIISAQKFLKDKKTHELWFEKAFEKTFLEAIG